jgi:hypothetical protein
VLEAASLIFKTPSEKSSLWPPQKETLHLTQIHRAEPVPDAGCKFLDAPLDQPYAPIGGAIAAKYGRENRTDVFASTHR